MGDLMIVELEQKRRHPRLECSGSARLYLLGEGLELPGRILDLSVEGCLVVLEEPMVLHADTVVELSFSVKQLPFRVRAQVKVKRSETTIGFQFLEISRRARGQLGELIEELGEKRMQQMPGSKYQTGGSGVEVRSLRSARERHLE
jgi:c-di-GMP-binding flagellar brake protein YcgR